MTAQHMRGVTRCGPAILVVVGLAIAGCSSDEEARQALLGHTFVASGEGLAEAPDGLVSARDVELVISHEGAGGVSWTAGCNHTGGSLEVTDDAFLVEMTRTTQWGCAEAAQEEVLTSLMQSRPTWQLEGDTLTLATESARIVFQRQSENASN